MTERQLSQLIRKAQAGDKKAFEKLIRSKGKNVSYIALSILKNQYDAEDAAQDAIESMLSHIKDLGAPEAFETWMYKIVFRACLKVKEKSKKQDVADIEELSGMGLSEERPALLPQVNSEKAEERRNLLNKIKELPENYRNCLYLFYYEDMTYVQIAEVLGSSVKDVANWLDRGKKKLKCEIGGKDLHGKRSAGLEGALVGAAFALDIKETVSNQNIFEESLKKVMLASSAAGAGGLWSLTASKVAAIAGLIFLIGMGGLFMNEFLLNPNTESVVLEESQTSLTTGQAESSDDNLTEGEKTSSNEDSSASDSLNERGEVTIGETIYSPTTEGYIIENEVYYGEVDPDDPDNFDTEKNPEYKSNKVDVVVETTQKKSEFFLGKTGDDLWLVIILCSGIALMAALAVMVSQRKRIKN